MYINFKRKYQRIFWLIIGFCLACIFVDKVHAQIPDYSYNSDEQQRVSIIWNELEGKTMQQANFTSSNSYLTDNTHILKQEEYPYLSVRVYDPNNTASPYFYYHEYTFIDDVENLSWLSQIYSYEQRYRVNVSGNYHLIRITVDTRDNSIVSKTSGFYVNGNLTHNFNSGAGGNNRSYTNFDLYKNGNIFISSSFTYSILPTYLSGYKKITLTIDDKYYMLSGLSSGSVYIPTSDFEEYGGRLSYYDNDLNSQPYTSYIQDYYKMPDGEFIRQDFDLSQYYGADWVMFSKYIYLEGEDNISYDIYVPNDIYDSEVVITPNPNTGGNDFDFDYKDSNGDIQNGQVQSIDLSQDNPLLGNIFSDFSSNTFGLTSIISAPLSLIRSLSSTSCTPLELPLPFVGGTLTLPCMYSFYENTFGTLFNLYQTITFGIISYWVIVRIFNLVKDFKNPDHDEIEVIDL